MLKEIKSDKRRIKCPGFKETAGRAFGILAFSAIAAAFLLGYNFLLERIVGLLVG